MGRSQVSFSGALLPPLKQKSKKKRKNRKRPGDRPKKFYKKIKSLPEGKCICGKKSIDSVGSCGENHRIINAKIRSYEREGFDGKFEWRERVL